MVDILERVELVNEIFLHYDEDGTGELNPLQVQTIHNDMRCGGISMRQVMASIEYVCVNEWVEPSELFDLLKEMDRRYFLIQDFKWEFSLLDTNGTDSITEDQARWFMQSVHKDLFSKRKWDKFLKSRAIPGCGVTFAEIEVDLCNVYNKFDLMEEELEEQRLREERARRKRERELYDAEEKRRLQKLRDEEARRRAEEERKRLEDDERKRREDEEARLRLKREKEEEEERMRRLAEEEERGWKEAEERARLEKLRLQEEEEEKRRREEEEIRKLKELEEQKKREQDAAKRAQIKGKEEAELEKEADAEIAAAQLAMNAASNAKARQEAEEREKIAKAKKQRAYNNRIRQNLKVAIQLRDRDKLIAGINDFKKAKLPDDEGDLATAERMLLMLDAKDKLRSAVKKRDANQIEKAMDHVRRNKFEHDLHHEMKEADALLIKLRRLERIRAEILELKQSTVAEIRSYQKPPPAVHVVMTATFLLLGHTEKETKIWKTVQALVGKTGKEGLKRRCLGLEPKTLTKDMKVTLRAKELFERFDLDEVRDVSAGAATFYLWGTTLIEEAEGILESEKM